MGHLKISHVNEDHMSSFAGLNITTFTNKQTAILLCSPASRAEDTVKKKRNGCLMHQNTYALERDWFNRKQVPMGTQLIGEVVGERIVVVSKLS